MASAHAHSCSLTVSFLQAARRVPLNSSWICPNTSPKVDGPTRPKQSPPSAHEPPKAGPSERTPTSGHPHTWFPHQDGSPRPSGLCLNVSFPVRPFLTTKHETEPPTPTAACLFLPYVHRPTVSSCSAVVSILSRRRGHMRQMLVWLRPPSPMPRTVLAFGASHNRGYQ